MEMGASSASLPADGGEIWAPILSDSLDWSLYSTTVLPPSQMEDEFYPDNEDDTMEIQQLLEGPRDEKYLDEWLEGAFNPSDCLWERNSTHQMEGGFYSPTRGDGMTVQTLADPKINLLDFIPKESWRHAPGARRPRERRTSPWMEDEFYPDNEDDTMEIQQLLEGPRDEKYLDEWLEGAFNPSDCLWERNSTHQMEGGFYSPTRGDGMTVQTLADPKINLLDFIPKESWRHAPGARRPRERRTSPWNQLRSEIMPLASGGSKCRGRKNNPRWAHEEVKILVEGIKKYGVGRWTEVKRDYFSPSDRTAVNIKDKWRNLLKACGIKSSSKKEKAQITMLQPLEQKLMNQIRELAVENPYPRKKEREENPHQTFGRGIPADPMCIPY